MGIEDVGLLTLTTVHDSPVCGKDSQHPLIPFEFELYKEANKSQSSK